MVVARASLKFKSLPADKKVTFGGGVVTKLTAAFTDPKNPFTDMPYTPAELKGYNDTLNTAAEGMLNGGKDASTAMKKAVKKWKEVFGDTGNAVTIVAQASDDIEGTILLAGFDPTKTGKGKRPLPGEINEFSARINHKAAAITVKAKKVSDDATGYLYTAVPEDARISYNGDVTIISVGDKDIYISVATKKEIDIAMLPKGVVYNVTMQAFNATGCGTAAVPQQVIPQGN